MRNKGKLSELTEKSKHAIINLKLVVQYAMNNEKAAEGMPTKLQFRKWVRTSLTRDAEIVLRLVDETEGRTLNRNFCKKDYATNVLTFAYDDGLSLSGDIVLCVPVVEKEAKQQHKKLTAHYAHLTTHGILHLQGWNHENECEASAMERLETTIVTKLGYDDPYLE